MRWWLLVMAIVVLGGCTSAKTAPQADDQRRYHDGRAWVQVRVLLDRLHVERGTPERVSAREAYLLRTPVSSVAELEEVARQMRAAQPDIRGLSAFIDEPSGTGVRRVRLTRQVLVRGKPGVELAGVVVNRGARVVRLIDGRTDTLIAESSSGELLAAFTLAEAIQASGGVVAAIPLSE